MVDTNCAWTPNEAIAMARKLKEYNLAWIEEPVYPVDDYDAMADGVTFVRSTRFRSRCLWLSSEKKFV